MSNFIKLEEKYTDSVNDNEKRLINMDTILQIIPAKDGSELLLSTGFRIYVTESIEEIEELLKGEKRANQNRMGEK